MSNMAGLPCGSAVWRQLERQITYLDDAGLTSLLRVMVLLGDAPSWFLQKLKPQHRSIVEQGPQIRALKPVYLLKRRALLAENAPMPAVLENLVATYAEPTQEDMWIDWLRWLSPLPLLQLQLPICAPDPAANQALNTQGA